MSVDIGPSCDQCRSMVQYSFTSTETRRLVRTDSPGRPPRLTQLLNYESCIRENSAYKPVATREFHLQINLQRATRLYLPAQSLPTSCTRVSQFRFSTNLRRACAARLGLRVQSLSTFCTRQFLSTNLRTPPSLAFRHPSTKLCHSIDYATEGVFLNISTH